jgi:hypothetical protein
MVSIPNEPQDIGQILSSFFEPILNWLKMKGKQPIPPNSAWKVWEQTKQNIAKVQEAHP